MWQQVSLNSIIITVFTIHNGQKTDVNAYFNAVGVIIHLSYLECVTSNCAQRIS